MFDVYLTTLTLEIDVGQGAARTLSADIYVNIQVNGNPTCLLGTSDARMRGCEVQSFTLRCRMHRCRLQTQNELSGVEISKRTTFLSSYTDVCVTCNDLVAWKTPRCDLPAWRHTGHHIRPNSPLHVALGKCGTRRVTCALQPVPPRLATPFALLRHRARFCPSEGRPAWTLRP